MTNAFVRKLMGFGPLTDADRAWLETVTKLSYEVGTDTDIIREGDNPDRVHVILEGFAARYKVTFEGKRQLFGYLIPGDFCDLHVAVLRRMDHSIATLTPCVVATLPTETVAELTETRPALARAFWWCSLVDEATLREWLLNMGQRPAAQGLAHLFCELHARLEAVGLTDDGHFDLPVTQVELADTMGLSFVHVNRSLAELRKQNLVTLRDNKIVIPHVGRLKAYAGFDPSYLHIRVPAGGDD
ncbi:Crp/Fnr family transcriptional regulator [Mesorhizobium sp. ArgA1]